MLTRMSEEDWDVVLMVFRAVLPRRGDKGRDDRKFLEALIILPFTTSLGGLCRPSSAIGTPSGSASGGSVGRGCSTPCSRRSPRRAPPPTSCRCSTRPRPVRMCRQPAQKGAERPSSWPLARRLLDQDPPQDRLRRPADRLRPDPRAGERQPALLAPPRPP